MNIYYRNRAEQGKLGVTRVDGVEEYEDAVQMVKEQLVADGVGYDDPVLALIQGGKK